LLLTARSAAAECRAEETALRAAHLSGFAADEAALRAGFAAETQHRARDAGG